MSILVIADTHLGLLTKKLQLGRYTLSLFSNEVESDSVQLSYFLEWIRERQEKGPYKLRLGRWGNGEAELKLPDTLVLLGDFLELWDASDAAVEFASREIWRTLGEIAEVGVKIVYLVGNHDFAMKDLADKTFPIGNTEIEVEGDVYEREIQTIGNGRRRYVFLHGHQFDTVFRRIGAWTLVSYIRDGAEAFRLYSWIILALMVLWPIVWFGFHAWFNWRVFDVTPMVLLAILGGVPRFIVWLARPLYNKLSGPRMLQVIQTTRYKSRKALDGFPAWWKDFCSGRDVSEDPIFVIYGHTHLADIFKTREIIAALTQNKNVLARLLRSIRGKEETVHGKVSLVNVPSWVYDSSKGHEPLLRDAALYIDEQGFKFIGWRWAEKRPGLGRSQGRPFYIPNEIIRSRADGNPLDSQTIEELRKIDWPNSMLEIWSHPYDKGSAGIARDYRDP